MFVKKAKDPQTWQNAAKLSDARDAWTFTPHSVRAGGGRPGLGKDDGCDAALTGFFIDQLLWRLFPALFPSQTHLPHLLYRRPHALR